MVGKTTKWLKMNEGPAVFLDELASGIVVMIAEGQDPVQILSTINQVTGFYLQDRDPTIVHQIN